MYIISALLIASVGLNIFLWFKKKERDTRLTAISRLIRQFEKENHLILEISAVNPDEIFLRAPGRS